MKEDDPVEELHKIREVIWKEAGGTPSAYAEYYYEMGRKRKQRDAMPILEVENSKQ